MLSSTALRTCIKICRKYIKVCRNWKKLRHRFTEFCYTRMWQRLCYVYKIILDSLFKDDLSITSKMSKRVEKHGARERKFEYKIYENHIPWQK